MNQRPFSLKNRINSFRYAIRGIVSAFRTEHNLWIHLFCAIVVVILGLSFSISQMEWIALNIAIGLVFITELLNTAIEYLCDVIEPNQNETIKICKDIAAAAVLVSAIVAVVVGLLVFYPYFLDKF